MWSPCGDSEVIQDLVNDLLGESGDDDRLGFHRDGTFCFRGFRTHSGSWSWLG